MRNFCTPTQWGERWTVLGRATALWTSPSQHPSCILTFILVLVSIFFGLDSNSANLLSSSINNNNKQQTIFNNLFVFHQCCVIFFQQKLPHQKYYHFLFTTKTLQYSLLLLIEIIKSIKRLLLQLGKHTKPKTNLFSNNCLSSVFCSHLLSAYIFWAKK